MKQCLCLLFICILTFAIIQKAEARRAEEKINVLSDETKEDQNEIGTFSELTTYADAVRKGMVHMVINGMDINEFEYSKPDEARFNSNVSRQIFHPFGGDVLYRDISPMFMAVESKGNWEFSGFPVPQLGTERSEMVMLLPNIRKEICQKINDEFTDMTNIPEWNTDISQITIEGLSIKDTTESSFPFKGDIKGCFKNNEKYTYYHILLER